MCRRETLALLYSAQLFSDWGVSVTIGVNKYVQIAAVLILAVAGLLVSAASNAVIDVYEFKDEDVRQRYLTFVEEMRCPKCQNQNLAGSDSPIAKDLRNELHRLLEEGKSDAEIVDFMVARYGDFILYKPRLQSNTYLLWWTPVILLGVGLVVVLLLGWANRRKPEIAAITEEDRARLDALLKKNK